MAYLSVQDLQDVAVSCTSNFYNNGVPLSVGLAKEASARNWNPDQIRRSIEATNTLAYLKSVDGADRTGEFPLADYNEIMKIASIPDGMLETQVPEKIETEADLKKKYAKSVEDQGFPVPCVEGELNKLEMPELSKTAEMALLKKEASRNKRALQDAEARAFHLALDLEKVALDLKKMPHAVEGLSVAATGSQFTKLARLTFGLENAPTRIDWVEAVPVHKDWKPALEKAASLSTMLTQAEETLEEIKHRSGLNKQAGILTSLAEGVGSAARKVVTAPFTYGANKIAAGVSAGIDTAATKAQTGFASTSLGQKMGIQPATLKASTVDTLASSKRVIAGGTLAAGAGLDAVSFKPHNDPSKNSAGNVWDALN